MARRTCHASERRGQAAWTTCSILFESGSGRPIVKGPRFAVWSGLVWSGRWRCWIRWVSPLPSSPQISTTTLQVDGGKKPRACRSSVNHRHDHVPRGPRKEPADTEVRADKSRRRLKYVCRSLAVGVALRRSAVPSGRDSSDYGRLIDGSDVLLRIGGCAVGFLWTFLPHRCPHPSGVSTALFQNHPSLFSVALIGLGGFLVLLRSVGCGMCVC